jgi:hypothetical protein
MTPAGTCVPDPECEARRREREARPVSRGYVREAPGGSYELPSLTPAPPPLPAPPQSAKPPAAAARPSPAPVFPPGGAKIAATSPRLRIADTGYGQLTELGGEVPGFGLYSYVILPLPSSRATRMLTEIFRDVAPVNELPAEPPRLNILYVPLLKDNAANFADLRRRLGRSPDKMAAEYTDTYYDYRTARALLDAVCNPPADSIRELCAGNLTRGPYLFTYAAPASKMSSVPPPFLFVDLSDVHEDAFRELLAAFNEQVKREDITDKARIETLRLKVLQYLLRAGDLVGPMKDAVNGFVHAASADADRPGAK